MSDYIQRTLTYRNEKGTVEKIADREILELASPVIILGEPGMGKTRLLHWIKEAPNWVFRSAGAFVHHPEPKQLVPDGKRLLIDGLDELSAAQESDPVHCVIGQLIKAGCPTFVLSCRAADWRGASARQDISEEYGSSPREMTLEPFSRAGAAEFLTPLLGVERAEELLTYLEDRGIPDLYGNPLTLGLFAEVAANGGHLPETRAELMRRATEIMWNERNDRHDKSPLSALDKATALASAGAASAALVLTGSEGVSLKPSSIDAAHTVRAAELRSLPDGEHAQTMVKSRLFAAPLDSSDNFRPVHRSVAEFLGARWLMRVTKDDLMRDRILASMTIDNGVPASVRGIHAWLAQDAKFALQVISADPYGVLRYGDADGLTVDQGRLLLQELKALQHANPYFRAEDWGRKSAKGLVHKELLGDVREILLGSDTSFHLRTLILGIIYGSPLADALADELRHIILTTDGRFGFSERHEAAEALVASGQERADWPQFISRLLSLKDENSARLALHMMDEIGFELFAPQLIAYASLANLGLLDQDEEMAEADEEAEHRSFGSLYIVAGGIADAQVAAVLDALAALHSNHDDGYGDGDDDIRTHYELRGLVDELIARQVAIEAPPPLRLLTWLRITGSRESTTAQARKSLENYLERAEQIRRAIQHQLIVVEHAPQQPWLRIMSLEKLNNALALGPDDVIYFLKMIGAEQHEAKENTGLWRELVAFGCRSVDRVEHILAAAAPFTQGVPELEAYLAMISSPQPKSDWQIQRERRREEEITKRTVAWANDREHFLANEQSLRAGEFQQIVDVSRAYFALYRDFDRSLPPPDRVGQWLGSDLQDAALAGFEAVIFRSDLPSAEEIADSYSESKYWNIVFAMIAGVMERLRQGLSLDDVPVDVRVAVCIALQHERVEDGKTSILQQLEGGLRSDPAVYERYARLLIEPSLKKRCTHIPGLYGFARSPANHALAIVLAAEWLKDIPDIPACIEMELMDLLSDAGRFQLLTELKRAREVRGYVGDEQRRNWQAMGLLCDFEATVGSLGPVSVDDRYLIWDLRHRFRGEHRGKQGQGVDFPAISQAWVIQNLRALWPRVNRPSGLTHGNTNAWDATDFIDTLIGRLARDVSAEGTEALRKLVVDVDDGYTPLLRHSYDLQRSARRETRFSGVTLERLKDVVERRPPKTSDDLAAVVHYALQCLQKELRGNDTDTIRKYWRDDGQPRDEDRCTDLLIEDLMRLMPAYGIGRVPQSDMPDGKIADIVFTINDVALPVECKGQWNRKLWSAAGDQLDAFYLRDWRAQDRGIYLVYWFGSDVESKYRLKGPPGKRACPTTPADLQRELSQSLAPDRRGSIGIVVLDLSHRGRSTV